MPRRATPEMIAGRLRREAEEKRLLELENGQSKHDYEESNEEDSESSEEEGEKVEVTRGKYGLI